MSLPYRFRNWGLRPLPFLAGSGLLALGTGCALALFALLEALLLRPLPGGAELYRLGEQGTGGWVHQISMNALPYPVIQSLRRAGTPFRDLCIIDTRDFALLPPSGEARRIPGAFVGGPFLGVLGLRPALGRDFDAADEAPGPPRAMLSDHLWRTRFGSDPGVLGRTVQVNGQACLVVGVGPAGFRGLEVDQPKDLFLGLGAYGSLAPSPDGERGPPTFLGAYGHLAPGLGRAQAQAALTAILRGWSKDDTLVENAQGLVEDRSADRGPRSEAFIHQPRLIVLGTTLLLLLAWVSVSILQLTEFHRRRRELQLRLALGAPPGRLVLESLGGTGLLALLGGLGGLALGALLLRAFLAFKGNSYTLLELDIPFGPRVWAFTLGLSLASTLAAGLVPVLLLLRLAPADALKEGGAQSARQGWREVLVVLQIGICLCLLTGAAAVGNQLRQRIRAPLGFQAEGLAMMKVEADFLGGSKEPPAAVGQRLLERARALPGVTSASLSSSAPMDVFRFIRAGRLEPRGPELSFDGLMVSRDHFATLGVPILRGRTFRPDEETPASRVVVVNQAFAAKHFPGQDPVGRRIYSDSGADEIVGVVADHRYLMGTPAASPMVFLPEGRFRFPAFWILVRGDQAPALLSAMRSMLREVEPGLPPTELSTLPRWLAAAEGPRYLAAGLLGLFGFLSMLLALAGLWGSLQVQARARRREWGIRCALGATPGHLLRRVMGQGLRLGLMGALLGASGAGLLGVWLRTQFPQDRPAMASAFGTAALLLTALVLIASAAPALWTSRLDPARSLRED